MTGSGPGWPWCRQAIPEGSERQKSTTGRSDEEKGAEEVSGWSDSMDGKMDNTVNRRKTVSTVSDTWSPRLLDRQALSASSSLNVLPSPVSDQESSGSSMEAQLRYHRLSLSPHQAEFIIAFPTLPLSPGQTPLSQGTAIL